jgi:uncharacterized membrane protein YgaE (UPF0421/DUF939 family)
MPRTFKPDRRALRRSILTSVSRLIGIILGTGAASLIHQMTGDGTLGWGVAITLTIVSLALILFAEYEREIDS